MTPEEAREICERTPADIYAPDTIAFDVLMEMTMCEPFGSMRVLDANTILLPGGGVRLHREPPEAL